jgi:hypothetical protein
MMGKIPSLLAHNDGAYRLKQLREAALADESGETLAATLRQVNR